MPDLKAAQNDKGRNKDIYGQDKFIYDHRTDTYICPAGVELKRKSMHKSRQSIDYAAATKECAKCLQKEQCTRNKSGRTIKRHFRQEDLDWMRGISATASAKRDIKTRQHLMERSFARGKRYGYDRCRWRGLWRVQIQEYMTAAIQNIQVLLKYGKNPLRKTATAIAEQRDLMKGRIRECFALQIIILHCKQTLLIKSNEQW